MKVHGRAQQSNNDKFKAIRHSVRTRSKSSDNGIERVPQRHAMQTCRHPKWGDYFFTSEI